MLKMAKKNNYEKINGFKESVGFNQKLGLDERDNIIMSLIQTNPGVSQEEIAKKIKLSQPSVGARLKRLKDKGILHTINGVNFKVVDLHMAKVDVNAEDPATVLSL